MNANIIWVRKLVIDGKKSQKIALEEKKLDMSLERLKKKKISSFAAVGNEKKLTRPVRRKQIHIFFGLIKGNS